MLRRLVFALTLAALPLAAAGQDRAQTLADIKAELAALMAEFNALKAELVASGGAASGAGGGDALQRLDAIEAELVRLTAQTEAVEITVNRVITDGTNRLGDLEFRLCELTEGCDIATLPEIAVLGGGPVSPLPSPVTDPAPGTDPNPPATGGAELAMSEQADFDRAKAALDAGDFAGAAALFATFGQTYPGGPLTQEAQYLRGEALAQSGDIAGSARAYLDAFSGQPDGTRAPEALMKLGLALAALGQVQEACVTLGEVGLRFPGSAAATEAAGVLPTLSCP